LCPSDNSLDVVIYDHMDGVGKEIYPRAMFEYKFIVKENSRIAYLENRRFHYTTWKKLDPEIKERIKI